MIYSEFIVILFVDIQCKDMNIIAKIIYPDWHLTAVSN